MTDQPTIRERVNARFTFELLDLPEGETEFRFTVERCEDGVFVSEAEVVAVYKPGGAAGDV